jgi:iron complex transport system ATP-binding protein
MKLEITNIVCGFGSRIVVNGFSTVINSGDILCLLGPNGVGKSTLFKTILGFLKPMGGDILLDGKTIFRLSAKEFARIIGYVPQIHIPPFPFKVIDVVMMGRTAHLGIFSAPSKHDRDIAEQALARLGISSLMERTYTEISGGERQMVLIARALAQEPAFLLLDEPTSNLDFGNQARVLQCIKNLAREAKLGIIMTTHFPDHVFQCEGDVALMEWNNVYLAGNAEQIITTENMRNTYGIEVKILRNDTEADLLLRSCVPIIRK